MAACRHPTRCSNGPPVESLSITRRCPRSTHRTPSNRCPRSFTVRIYVFGSSFFTIFLLTTRSEGGAVEIDRTQVLRARLLAALVLLALLLRNGKFLG